MYGEYEFEAFVDKSFDTFYEIFEHLNYGIYYEKFYVPVSTDNRHELYLYYSPETNAYYTVLSGKFYKLLQLRKKDTLYILRQRVKAQNLLSRMLWKKTAEAQDLDGIKLMVCRSDNV